MKKRTEIINKGITKLVGVLLVIAGIYVEVKYGRHVFNGADLFLLTCASLAVVLFFNSITDVKECFVKKLNSLKEIFSSDDEEFEDFSEESNYSKIEVDEDEYEDD